MKNYFLVLLVLLGVCFFFFNNEEEIRVRVLSNSNSKEDILYKEEVVTYLKEQIFPFIELNDESFEKNHKKIEQMLNVKFNNITVTYENHIFMNKTYNDNALENKEYKTLLVSIGEGLGSNWWGSIFDNTLQKESVDEVKYEWYFSKYTGE